MEGTRDYLISVPSGYIEQSKLILKIAHLSKVWWENSD